MARGKGVKRNPKPPASVILCAWCQKIVKVLDQGKGVVREIPLSESGFTVKDFALHGSHGICAKCGKRLMKEAKALKNPTSNPPPWVRDKAKWKEAVKLAQLSYGQKIGSKEVANVYAVIVTIYKNLGGRIARKTKRNPSEGEWRAVIDLFSEFHDFEPTSVIVHEVESLDIPGVLVRLGDLVELTYKSDKFDKRSRLYVHKFGRDKPTLAVCKNGRLFIVGGGYKVTSRGIER